MKRRSDQRDKIDRNEKAGASDTELEHFRRAMADVVPLAPDPRGRVRPVPPTSEARAPAPSKSSSAGQDDEQFETAYAAPGVDRRELRKLKRGGHAATSHLDLHGETATEAIALVKQFIDRSRHRHRTICIVHGRGLHSAGNVSILKARVRACLRQHLAVLAYADAPLADGGPGAVYVLLRK